MAVAHNWLHMLNIHNFILPSYWNISNLTISDTYSDKRLASCKPFRHQDVYPNAVIFDNGNDATCQINLISNGTTYLSKCKCLVLCVLEKKWNCYPHNIEIFSNFRVRGGDKSIFERIDASSNDLYNSEILLAS